MLVCHLHRHRTSSVADHRHVAFQTESKPAIEKASAGQPYYLTKRNPMRALIFVVAIVLLMAVIGWLRFTSDDGDPSVRVDTDKMKQDTSSLVETTKDAADGAANAIDRAAGNIDASIDREPVETNP
jgi:hypothetical protein